MCHKDFELLIIWDDRLIWNILSLQVNNAYSVPLVLKKKKQGLELVFLNGRKMPSSGKY